MDDRAKLNDLARDEITALEEADGIKVTYDDVVLINDLAWRVTNHEGRMLLSRGRPVYCGGAWLWPLTLRAYEWCEVNNVALNTGSIELAYAMAHGRSDGNELDEDGEQPIREAVKKWAKGLRCTAAELAEAIKQVDNQDASFEPPKLANGETMSAGDFVAHLCATVGGEPDLWERRVSSGYAFAQVAALSVIQAQAAGKPSGHDPRLRGERALGYAIKQIRERHNGA